MVRILCNDEWSFENEVLNGMGRDGLAYGRVEVELNIEDMHVGGLVGEAGYERSVFGVVPGGFKGHPAKNGGSISRR